MTSDDLFICLFSWFAQKCVFLHGWDWSHVCGLIIWEDDVRGRKATQAYGTLAHNAKSSKNKWKQTQQACLSSSLAEVRGIWKNVSMGSVLEAWSKKK